MSGVQKSVVGTCTAVEQKPGSEWMRFMVEVQGDKYPQRLDTRDEDVIAAAKGVGAQIATWTFNEVESDKINPRNNKPYINRYLEGVELGGVPGTGAQSGQSSGGGGGGGGSNQYSPEEIERFDERERRDYRSRAWGQTLGAFENTIKADDDPILLFEKLKPFQRKVYEDIVGDLAKAPEPAGLSPADDDIPF